MKTLSLFIGALLAAVLSTPVAAGAADCARIVEATNRSDDAQAIAARFHTTINEVEHCKTVGQVGAYERTPQETMAKLSKENCSRLLQESSQEPAPVVAQRHHIQVEDIERCKAANLVDR